MDLVHHQCDELAGLLRKTPDVRTAYPYFSVPGSGPTAAILRVRQAAAGVLARAWSRSTGWWFGQDGFHAPGSGFDGVYRGTPPVASRKRTRGSGA